MKKPKSLIIILVLFSLLTTCAHNQKFDNVDNFRVTPLDDGKSVKIDNYIGTSQFVSIPPVIHGMTVKEIGDEAFKDKEIISVTIPNSVIIIGDRAFIGNRLTSLTIPDSVTVIGKEAFSGDMTNSQERTAERGMYVTGNMINPYRTDEEIEESNKNKHTRYLQYRFKNNIANLTLGKKVTTIKEKAFEYNWINKLVIPNNVITIEKEAFAENEITNVTIGKKVANLAGFERNKLTSINIPKSVINIESDAFSGNQLKNLVIPNSVITIESRAFAENELTNITIGKRVANLAGFENNNLTSINIPNSVITIGYRAFHGNKLINFTIPDSVTAIEDYAFSGNQLKNLVIPNSVITIGSGAFSKNDLTNVTIGNKTKIGGYAFFENPLTRITIGSNVEVGEYIDFSGPPAMPRKKVDTGLGTKDIPYYVYIDDPPPNYNPQWITISEFSEAFDNGFSDYYMKRANRRAGTYVRNGDRWSIWEEDR